jgi:hypothetical protein
LNAHAQRQFSAHGFNVEIHVAFDQTDEWGDLVRGLAAQGPIVSMSPRTDIGICLRSPQSLFTTFLSTS